MRPGDRPSCPLPISTTQTARGLLRIYARLKGEQLKHSTGEDVLVQSDEATLLMGHIAALMPFLGVDFAPEALKPLRTRVQIGPLGYGDVRAGVLAQLRAHGGWMTYAEMADSIISQERLTLTPAQRKHFLQKLRDATLVLAQAGAVEPEQRVKKGDGQQLQRWRLSQTMFRSRRA
jgi:hypothetical protein